MAENRLAWEKSPYLLQHKDNPVDWFPWGEEAFAKAREEDKPIFLSIGYSTCHWCHVMAHESFEKEEIAAEMNRYFVNVKVDREERPDVDHLYMTFVQSTTGSGGWPMSVWLTPDLKPFAGGTYFPPEDRHGRAGFPNVCRQLGEAWLKQREAIEDQGQRVIEALREMVADRDEENVDWREMSEMAVAKFVTLFDEIKGGFGDGAKFPQPSVLGFLLREGWRKIPENKEDAVSLNMGVYTLRQILYGGIRDHLGGGFHRYTVDPAWHVPHFEKMLYDQAQLLTLCVDAWQLTGEEVFRSVALETAGYVMRDMSHPAGGFYSAEDADSLDEDGNMAEGAYYIWKQDEIDEILGEDSPLFCSAYGINPSGNAPEGADPHEEFVGKNILIRWMLDEDLIAKFGYSQEEVSEKLNRAKETLLRERGKRPRPHLDDKILAGWNGLMLGAMAYAGRVLGEERFVARARQAAEFIRDEMMTDGELCRSYRDGRSSVTGFCADYAFCAYGMLELFEATQDWEWVKLASKLQDELDKNFLAENGGYYTTHVKETQLPVRVREDYDGAEPTGNSYALRNQLRLAALTRDTRFIESADRLLSAYSSHIQSLPVASPWMLIGGHERVSSSPTLLVIGDKSKWQPFVDFWNRSFRGEGVLVCVDPQNMKDVPPGIGKMLEGLELIKFQDSCQAVLCKGETCGLPVKTPEELEI